MQEQITIHQDIRIHNITFILEKTVPYELLTIIMQMKEPIQYQIDIV